MIEFNVLTVGELYNIILQIYPEEKCKNDVQILWINIEGGIIRIVLENLVDISFGVKGKEK